ncbi:protein STAY-GREEN, chloroplastic [Amborella trichopoda]|uniref:protein STAY-GREEN, chloroplastic n=1 Tax=Amborella trichopoda TaxID=13333 RepID=UPI0005D31675|nr:protein STAY-GREEN, chloroplastic [Amborella trichopoda]|eukprot:XP_011628941.1 protein STAY-GREEN, chloroplastic [Amborella trichopoda]
MAIANPAVSLSSLTRKPIFKQGSITPYSSSLLGRNPLLFGNQILLSKKSRSKISIFPVARIFGPAIFEASKLKVLFLGVEEDKHPAKLPRTYTLTHSDITAKLTLAISQTINRAQLQGWYNRLQRDEVVAEWKKVKGKMSLHVHCHISGGHFLLDLIAKLRYYIFCKELPVVLKAVVHGDGNLFSKHPELEDALVWVYFHSNLPQFNRVECWGRLKDDDQGAHKTVEASGEGLAEWSTVKEEGPKSHWGRPMPCQTDCDCCFPPSSLIPWPHDFEEDNIQQNMQHDTPQSSSLHVN